MALVNAGALQKQYGADTCFSGLAFEIQPGDRIGLVGRNGCGKSSLLRILAGTDKEYSGSISFAKNLRIGFLEQNVTFEAGATVLEAVCSAGGDVFQLETEIERVHHAMADAGGGAELDRLGRELDRLQEAFELAGGYDFEARVRRIMSGVGIPESMTGQMVADLSGGERHRVALARLLMEEPDIWLLDEPTNHLDVDGIFFLERFLASHAGAVVLVSHDRRFLDTVTNETWEIENTRFYQYPASYSRSRFLREERLMNEQTAFGKQQEHIKKQEEYIRRFKAGQRARQAKGRLRRLERLERLEGPEAQQRAMALSFPCRYRLGTKVLALEGVSKSFPKKDLFSDMSFVLEPGEVLAILGPNGAGKTTLFDMLLNQLPADEGDITWGESARMGILRQHDRFPDESLTPLQYLQRDWATTADQDLRSILGAMLFSGEDALREVRGFSGGECKRLMLTRLLMEGHNVLLLDEPTNHLDLHSREALEVALSQYEGSVLLVSHDRYFIDALADRSLWIEDGGCWLTDGGFSEAWDARQARIQASSNKKSSSPSKATPAKVAPLLAEVSVPMEAAAKSSTPPRKPGPYAKLKLEKLEEEIMTLEENLERLNALFADPSVYQDAERVKAIHGEVDAAREKLTQMEEEYAARG